MDVLFLCSLVDGDPISCTFEAGTCQYTQEISDDFDWTRHTRSTASVNTGPISDHTLGLQNQGYFMYIEASSPRKPGDKARLISPSGHTEGGRYSVGFYYSMHGSGIGTLNVYVNKLSTTPSFSVKGNMGTSWHFGCVDLHSYTTFNIVFEGLVGISFYGDIAIDDVKLQTGGCSSFGTTTPSGHHVTPTSGTLDGDPISCTFELGICQYTQEISDDFDWTRHTRSTGSVNTGPISDHTLGLQNQGYFMYIEASSPRKPGDKARLISPSGHTEGGRYSVGFYYSMHGSGIGTLNVYVNKLSTTPSFSVKGNMGTSWHFGCVDLHSYTTFNIVFEGLVGMSFYGDIAIDDVKLQTGGCSSFGTTTPSGHHVTPTSGTLDGDPISCTFEAGTCQYTQEISDDFDWTRHTRSTASVNTGPISDHTLGLQNQGYYMYIEASSPRKSGDKARLISPTGHTEGGRYSVGFYYSMHGSGIGTLNVYVNKFSTTPSFSVKGNMGTSWHFGCVDLHSYTTFNIVFEGLVGMSFYGDIAIDDVKLQTSGCSSFGTTTPSGHHVTPTSGTLSTSSLACSFEHGTCSYTQDKTDNRDWSVHAGNTTSVATGPGNDHTLPLGHGHYIYMESSSPAKPGNKARLLSPTVTPSKGHNSVTFWYHMYGADMGTLNVYTKTGTSLGTSRFHVSGNQGSVWRQGCVDISSVGTSPFQLVFEGIVGPSFHSDIAIDDVSVSYSHCHLTTHAPQTTTDPTDIYITIDLDASTTGHMYTTSPLPVSPGTSSVTCTFEQQHVCGYTMTSQSTSLKYHWQWTSGQTINSHTGPMRDHTTGHGHYMAAVSLGTTSAVGARTNLYSPYFDTTGQHMSVHFWYNTFSIVPTDYGALFLYLDQNGRHGNSLYSSIQAHHSTNWQPVCVDLPTNMHGIRLLFQAVHGSGVHGDIAVDDVTLTSGKCGSTSMTTASHLGHWSSWGSYSPCSSTCGSSYRVRTRVCSGGSVCYGHGTQTLACHMPSCTTVPTTTVQTRVDGSWSFWTTWSQCSTSCGMGSIVRTRMCSNPAPSGGGDKCTGETSDNKDCSSGPCPFWSHWYDGPCSTTCNNGTMEQVRHCSTGHDEDCTGSPYQHVTCTNTICI